MRAYLKIVSLRFLQISGAHRAKARRARSGGSFADLDTSGPLQHLLRLLEARMGNRGKREFIQVLRPVANVKTTSAADYAALVSGRAA